MRVGIYVRVSTEIQAEEGYSINEQVARLKSYCHARDWTIVKQYIDPGFSGAKMERPALQDLITDCSKKLFDLVLVYKLDRLSRSQKDTLYMIEEVFNKNNIAFVSMNENFDTSTSFGKAMIGILSVFAQLEREQIKERMTMGRVARAKDGLFHGGSTSPIGYDYEDGKLVVNEYEAVQVKLIFQMFLDGDGLNTIAKNMHKKFTNRYGSYNNASSIYSILANSNYIGKVKFNNEEFDGIHEPIIDEKDFYTAQEILKKRKRDSIGKGYFNAVTLLTGLLYCKNCGGKYGAVKYEYKPTNYLRYKYVCYSRSKKSPKQIKDPNCRNKMWFTDDLDNLVIQEIYKLRFDDSYFEDNKIDDSKDIHINEVINKKIEAIDKQTSKLLDLFSLDTIPYETLSSKIQQLNEEKSNLISQKVESPLEQGKMSKKQVFTTIDALEKIINDGSLEEKRKLVFALIEKIELDKENVYIHWNF